MDELLTADGMTQMAAEELIEATPAFALWVGSRGWKRMISNFIKYKSKTRIAPLGAQGRALTGSRLPGVLKAASNAKIRGAIKAAKAKVAKLNAKVFGPIMFTLQVVGMVLDVDDAAGFNAQVPQGGVDMNMTKMLQVFNEFPEIREAGVSFPREYLPEETLEWARFANNEVMTDHHLDLSLDYLDRLVINSNGERIKASWDEVDTARSDVAKEEMKEVESGGMLWDLAGKNKDVHAGLKRWWWLILVLVCVIVLTLGLGIGLGLRNRKKSLPVP
jgi:hypothetical protein